MSTSRKKTAASIIWFEIPADNLDRAKKFYSELFGWKISAVSRHDESRSAKLPAH